jgi:3-oxoacyl-[acyl-carrier protein] reductase
MKDDHGMPLGLAGKHALVCGASQGIGLAAAQQLAGLGAAVTLLARNETRLQEALTTLPGAGHRIAVADFASPSDVQTAVDAVVARGDVHVLVNNSGGPAGGPITEAPAEAFEATFRQHLINNQLLAQAVLPGMKRAQWGRIVNVISTSVKAPLNGLGVSNTVRGAVANWAKTWANEVGHLGITVNNVLPGATHTARLTSLAEAKAARTGGSPEEVLAEMASKVPAGRVGRPEEVGYAIAFLCSPAAGYISGINLPVDGGRTPSL